MTIEKQQAKATEATLNRIFTIPESPETTLGKIERQISENLGGFLNEHIVALEKPLTEIEQDFSGANIPEQPSFVSDHTQHLLDKLVAQSVHTASPSFIGHMTSALPYFVLPLSKIMVGLNQNLVKIETSKAFTPLERQVLGMMHNLVYKQADDFYDAHMHSRTHALGAFCSGGTIANLTALWVARNNAFKAQGSFKGIAAEGLHKALAYYGYDDAVILVSERGHYSIKKSADVLGLGRDNVIAVATDSEQKIDIEQLRKCCESLSKQNKKIMAIVGIAGTTETGKVDPLAEMAEVARQYQAHFHVDAAWGGATLLSNNYRHLLAGIDEADSVTIDAHKQMYIPMGAGIVVFKDAEAANIIKHHAEYILRKGSKDLGSHTLEGSRPGMALLLYASLHIISRPGYELLIDKGIEKAHYFAQLIAQHDDFELMTAPELCLLTYRYVPAWLQQKLKNKNTPLATEELINAKLDRLTKVIQKQQRESGQSFVSRTRINMERYNNRLVVVFRVVLANPLTSKEVLQEILNEQVAIAEQHQHLLADFT
ncbi:pyridoxal-dependent aspartate 1-decarboxylase PanP [Thalassotalea agarivorans]|uniref:Glutamate decarboxylase n=1 Tax=Thalassotalea agarivorans TaxID=349064 RepID=A0A1I0GM92_THASX|nr:putative pyridoxal-dependent aspartate 1-decarboxylase [Thalassotalea agarivorans]SET72107.1 glutamate decarboxylase [Thalassotalea agarivorans]